MRFHNLWVRPSEQADDILKILPGILAYRVQILSTPQVLQGFFDLQGTWESRMAKHRIFWKRPEGHCPVIIPIDLAALRSLPWTPAA